MAKRWLLAKYRGDRSQKEMGKKYGVSQQAWSAWEHGEYTPSLYIMKRLERDTGIPMETLFYDFFHKI